MPNRTRRSAKSSKVVKVDTPSPGPVGSMTAEIRRLASESAKKVSAAQQAAPRDEERDAVPAVITVPARTVQPPDNNHVGSDTTPVLVIPFQEAGL